MLVNSMNRDKALFQEGNGKIQILIQVKLKIMFQ